ncbi:MAG: hypothetical protein IJX65_02045 [Alistipes sp.]|nr:hypothetical protein [Alistipes sp.]
MKKLFVIIVCLLCGVATSLAQERLDSLFYLNGKIEVVSILKNSSQAIECNYIGEDLVSLIEKSELYKIVFRSGRVEVCNEVKKVEYDQIYFANGSMIDAKVVKLSEESVDYVLPNENLPITTYKSLLNKIVFANGRIEKFGNLLQIKRITSEEQWEDVVVSYNESDTRGLERVAEISKASGWGGELASGVGYNKAIKLCQKEAAKLRCGLILINATPNAQNVRYGAGVRVNVTAYRLPKRNTSNVNTEPLSLYGLYGDDAVIVELSEDGKHGKAIKTFNMVSSYRNAQLKCQELEIGEGWRLPNTGEMLSIMKNRDVINKTLKAEGLVLLSSKFNYWCYAAEPTIIDAKTLQTAVRGQNQLAYDYIAILDF